MRSKAFKGQLWGEQEQRLRHFHVELERSSESPEFQAQGCLALPQQDKGQMAAKRLKNFIFFT